MKILIVGPSWVGDMVMSQSLYITLKDKYPDAQIDVLAPAWCKPILERMPEVGEAIEMPVGHGSFNLKARWRIGRSLKNRGYDHAYILPNSAKSALIPLFAGIKVRTGWKGEMRYGLLNDLRPDKRVFQFMVERYVALAYSRNSMKEEVSIKHSCPFPKLEQDPASQKNTIEKLGLSRHQQVVGLCPGAEFGPAKRWPESKYAEVAKYVISKGGHIWMFGSQKDHEVTEGIRNLLPASHRELCFNLAGKTSLNEAVDLLAACNTVVSNDSGLMHVSAAVGTEVIAIYGSSSPDYTPPLTKKLHIIHTDIDCRPCFKRECPLGHQECLTKLSPNQVIDAINTILE
ncbi:lipopolysaccharide heptosyltransferase II [Vibrio coralliilyticus]|uniref:lipopolysaccharide heptosyltransferase II n=1 Tax=Vibrio coralliilyticus TaxID=190893 RepID=UPI00148DC879|nr:lipopolysaccharide heptosyltransferase II [Vibrio coralliilyticus]NOI30727.1 lipopolysaccharide heptosyltransferase II [Vibrio coralliilyticus]NOI49726.1 lipopolysaccharide heptosyltransferase II [Vibrio coralliilyticus]